MKRLLNRCLTLFSIFVLSFFAFSSIAKADQSSEYISIEGKSRVDKAPISITDIEFVYHDDTIVEIYGLKGNIYNASYNKLNVDINIDYYNSQYELVTSSTYSQDIPSQQIYEYVQMAEVSNFNVSSIAYYSMDVTIRNAIVNYPEPSDDISKYGNYDYVIDSYSMDIVVGEDNVLKIKETINAYFFTSKHGIYRVIPLKNEIHRADGTTSTVNVKISDIEVNTNVDKTIEDGYLYLALGSKFKTVLGAQTYVIEYNYNLGKDRPKDYDEFYFNIIGPYWETVMGKVDFKITMPKDFDTTKVGFSKGYLGTNYDNNVKYLIKDNVIEGYVLNLGEQEALTVRIELNEGYFVGAGLYKGSWGYILYAIPVILLIIAFLLWYKYGKDEIVTEVVSLYPPGGYNSLEIGYYYKGDVAPQDVISLIIYLANKGYLKIVEEKNDDFKLIKLKEYDGDNEYEKTLFKGLFSSKKMPKDEEIDELIDKGILSRNIDRSIIKIVNKKSVGTKLQKPAESIYRKLTEKGKKQIFCDTSMKKTIILVLSSLISVIIAFFVPLYSVYMGDMLVGCMIVGPIFVYCGLLLLIAVLTNKYTGTVRSGKDNRILSKWKKNFILLFFGIFFTCIPCLLWIDLIKYVSNLMLPFFMALVCSGIIMIFQLHMTKRNEFGRKILGEIKGFKRFLETAEKQKLESLIEEDPSYFFNILPYAYVLDVSDKWINKFEDIPIPQFMDQTTINVTATSLRTTLLIQDSLRGLIDFSPARMYNSPRSYRGSFGGSGGGFSGGGFSGGGFGGGGGGSW